jgi:hypothetical protein
MSRRLTIDLTDKAELAIERLKEVTALSTPGIFRMALSEFYDKWFPQDKDDDDFEEVAIR